MFHKVAQKSLYKDAWVELFQDQIAFSDGTKGTYAWVNRKNGVGVVVVTADQNILLHREFRYVIQEYSWEVQGGGIDEGEEPAVAAARELKEESGITVQPSELLHLGTFYPLHSFNTETVSLFLARVDALNLSIEGTEQSEDIVEQRFFSFDEALHMIDTGKISDAFTAHAIQMAVRKVRAHS